MINSVWPACTWPPGWRDRLFTVPLTGAEIGSPFSLTQDPQRLAEPNLIAGFNQPLPNAAGDLTVYTVAACRYRLLILILRRLQAAVVGKLSLGAPACQFAVECQLAPLLKGVNLLTLRRQILLVLIQTECSSSTRSG